MSSAQAKAKASGPRKASKAYCVCRTPDDGSPMIHCSSCKDWFHFRCVELSERDAEDIRSYVCPPCHQKTGARTIKEWEGPDAVQEARDDMRVTRAAASAAAKNKQSAQQVQPVKAEERDSEPPSDESDEFDPQAEKEKEVMQRRGRRQAHAPEESDDESHRSTSPKRLRKASGPARKPEPAQPPPKAASPTSASTSAPAPAPTPAHAPASQTKRKKTMSAQPLPPPKRARSESGTGEDPARKYCLTKLQELFCQIFARYPFIPEPAREGEEVAAASDEAPVLPLQPTKKPEELSDEEKEGLNARAQQFGIDVEQCMFELYSEPGEGGRQVVAGKYKERFRMLTFNLSKPDRVILHMRIASSRISPKELSTMSSTDLASEEEKESIKKLEQEALAHSILKKSTVPRAKITHKGLQDIEDVTGAGQREAERERADAEEERIDRERRERLRLQAQRAQSQQGSAPPESPVVPTPTSASWGAPPALPPASAAASSSSSATATTSRPPVHPLFVPSASDFVPPAVGAGEGELNLADLINIDEDPSGEVAMTPVESLPTPFAESPSQPLSSSTSDPHTAPSGPPHPHPQGPHEPAVSPPAGLSPFAAKGSQPGLPAFDLNALWTPTADGSVDTKPVEGSEEARAQDEPMDEDRPVGTELAGPDEQAEDLDFDMLLGNIDEEQKKEPEPEPLTPEAQRAVFDAQPPVWSGNISMPLDSAIPQEVALVARQIGGRILGNNVSLWQMLFPTHELRIDGRVPVEKSAQYLTQVRLNPSKELIASAFSPAPGADSAGFHGLKHHLLSKGRHGLIFPWGHNPKASAPGRELYIIPLLSSEPIPEYMQLLDHLQLPPERSSDYLVGIWVLTKGKLVAPPAVPPATTPVPSSSTTAAPSIDFAQLQQFGIVPPMSSLSPMPPLSHSNSGSQSHLHAASPPHPSVPVPIGLSGLSPPQASSTPPQPAAAVNPNLAAEVASLTPEQIQLMLQSLTKTAPTLAAGMQHPSTQQPNPYASSAPQNQGIWPPPAPNQYAPPYPATQPQHNPPVPPPYPDDHNHEYGYGSNQPSYGQADRYGDRPYPNAHGGFRGRGGRGRGGNRGWQKGGVRGRGGPPPTGPRNRNASGGGWGGNSQQQRHWD